MQRRAYMRALADVYMRNVAYAHSTSLTRSRSDTLVRTCVMHMHTARQTASDTQTGYLMNTHSTQKNMRAHTHTQAFMHV